MMDEEMMSAEIPTPPLSESPCLLNCRMELRSYPPVWRRLPNTSFGIGMGLAGQAILWRSVQDTQLFGASYDDLTGSVNFVFWASSLLISALLLGCYVGKAIFYFPLVEDEIRDGSRVHFCNMPHLILAMLNIGLPASVEGMSPTGRVVCYTISLIAQLYSTSYIYQSWLFSVDSNISCSKPQFLLSTVGWFILAALGSDLRIEEVWGLDLPNFCLSIGLMMYIMVAISIFNCIHANPRAKGSPALFLLVAPPAVGVGAWDSIERHMTAHLDTDASSTIVFAMGAQMLLGWCMGLVLLLLRVGPTILQRPPVLGAYWAYVFPLAALATATVRYASVNTSMAAMVLAVVFVILSLLAVAIVLCRMLVHASWVLLRKAQWDDPLLSEDRLASVEAIAYKELLPLIETA